MQKLNVETELGQMRQSERTAELRFTNTRGRTEAWIVAVTPTELQETFRQSVSEAYQDDAVDSRLGRQAEIITRLMRVIEKHNLQEEARTA